MTRRMHLQPGDAAYVADLRSAMLTQTAPRSMAMMALMAVILLAGTAWAAVARVEEITQGSARVIPKAREQIIQSLEGGLLAGLDVHEGDIVERGQTLLRIDPTRAGALYRESYTKVMALNATAARLRAEAYNRPLVFAPELLEQKEVVAQERSAYEARRAAQEDALAAIGRSYDLAAREIALSQPLAERGLMSEIELLKMRRQANELRMQIAERRNKFQTDAGAELGKVEMELAQTRENLIGRADVMERTTVTAPVRGVVKNIRVNTIGGVIQPGEHIMEIVPLEGQLLVEARIRPADVAFLRPGLPAVVKVSAYDYSIYGGLKGHVQLISADTLRDEQRTGPRSDEPYYRVLVLTDASTLGVAGKPLPIIPGMTATVEIRTGEKNILTYLLKPVLKAREAFRER